MCGIAGIVRSDDTFSIEGQLRAMATSMAHRGPDDEGISILACDRTTVGLCARRLAIQDVSPNGHQPMVGVRTGNHICLNGELYNVTEVRATLEARGYSFRGHSDTEVVLAAFEEWGPECLGRLRGMFAVAIWEPGQRRLFLARDRLGIKPLYYHERPGAFVFASEIRTLLTTRLVAPRLSGHGLESFLGLGAVVEPGTILEDVYALPAGHYGLWKDGRLELTRYWSLADAFHASGRKVGLSEARDRLRALLEGAVRQHLVSDVPVGVFLSGGIDSSALVGLVARVAERPPTTVSVVFPQKRYTEERYIRLVSQRFGTDHRQIEIDDAGALRHVPDALAAMDQPTFDGVNTYIVSRLAKNAGLTVALSGLGADELFGGYDTFRIVPRLKAIYSRVPRVLARHVAVVARRGLGDTDRGRKLARWLATENIDSDAYVLRRELFGPDALAGLLNGRLGDAGKWTAGGPLWNGVFDPFPTDQANSISFSELDVYMRNILLRDTDVMSMACSLEVRVPFLDHEIVGFVASLDGRLKTEGRTPKPLLVETLADLLPDDVVHRRKMGFALPFPDWLRGPLRREVASVLLDRRFGGQVVERLDHEAVAGVWNRFLAGKGVWTRPWSLYVLKVWGEHHLPAVARPGIRGARG